jgi:rod shape determining protein RodA
VLFVAGMRVRHLLVVVALVVALAATVVTVLPAVGIDVLEPYQQDRLTSFLNPSADPAETGYNQYQSRIAIGSGGMVGKGAEGATQTNGAFLPENHTDFVFASLGEQRGFIGGALLLGLFTIVLWRTLRAIAISSSMFGSLVAAGIFGWFLASLFINVGMTIGVAPVTGIPLPLVSYGGSGTIAALLALGVVQSIVVRSRMAGSRLS